jgi:hypothetical protein
MGQFQGASGIAIYETMELCLSTAKQKRIIGR